ncbi:MAG: tyrosine-protein phosphatase [Saprospiraceae bacterium]|nr:tyrosine-protein phosphatase [Saprospiraceae bacterium]
MDRFIDIAGAQNFRDLGGYRTKDGRRIKWRSIFRSGQLSWIRDAEEHKMAALQLKTICDFRTTAEQTASPDRWFQIDQLNRCSYPIGEGRLDKVDWMENASRGEGRESYLYKSNRSYVVKNAERYKAFFELLLDERNYPLLFHCTAGKDRTGFAAALLLSALGVDQDTIMEDYLLTNFYLEQKGGWDMLQRAADKFGFNLQRVKPILIAHEVYIQGAYDAIVEQYGNMDEFLEKAIGIGSAEKEKLQEICLDQG